jgi:predicted nucleotidyltransferase
MSESVSSKEELIERLSTLLEKEENVRFAYLFGSWAEETASVHSDIDIALYLEREDFEEELALLHTLQKALKVPVDLSVLNRTYNIDLLDEIIRRGILLKDHSERLDYELRKWQEILDFRAERKRKDVA